MAIIKIGDASDGGWIRSGDRVGVDRGGANAKARAGAPSHPGYAPAFWYPFLWGRVGSGAAWSAASTRMIPFMIHDRVTITDVALRVLTLFAGGTFGLAIYAHNPATGRPTGTPLAQTVTTLSTAAAALISSPLVSSVTLDPGMYWVACQLDNTTAVFQGLTGETTWPGYFAGAPAAANILSGSATTLQTISFASPHGTWPDVTGVTGSEISNNQNFYPAFKVAA
jgi:hypothetical protein